MEPNRRIHKDRREKPTPGLSLFSFRGRRKSFRRKEDQKRGGYVDSYGPGLLFLLTIIVALNLLDALFTKLILDDGGWEVNPIVRSVIEVYGERFWIWKFAIVSIPLVLLCIHSKFRLVMAVLFGITGISVILILYEMALYFHWGALQ